MPDSSRYSSFELYRRAFLQVKPYWLHLTAVALLGLLATPIALLSPLPLKIAVDTALGPYPLPGALEYWWPGSTSSKSAALTVAVALLLLVTLVNLGQRFGQWLLQEYTGTSIVLSFRGALFEHVQRLSLSYHDAAGMSDATYRVQYDAPAIQGLVLWGVIPLVTSALTMVCMIYVIMQISVELALVALAASPILVLLTALHSPVLRARWERIKIVETSTLSIVQEVFGAIRVVKAFSREDSELARFVTKSTDGIRERLRVVLVESSLALTTGLTVGIGTAVVLVIGVRQVQATELTLGELLLVMSYLTQLYLPLQTIGRQVAEQQGSLTGAARSFALLDQAPAIVDRHGSRHISRAAGHIEIRNVTFAYGNGPTVLDGVSLNVPAGACVGIAGPTGSGKTTLLNLLIRFYDPTNGQILLDGIDIREYRLTDLRDQFALVLQEPILFSTTIAENIAYGRLGASHEQIIAAARAAEAHEFISTLKDGYETRVGDRGVLLSGGERQRLTLARAFLRDSPILILDEPTSSIDVETEDAILHATRRLIAGRTTFMIAHRLRTLDGFDIRLRLRGGRLELLEPPCTPVLAAGKSMVVGNIDNADLVRPCSV
jgi:ATP-binding cassette subfamily B protein